MRPAARLSGVTLPQPGIFALGTRSHYHLEFDLLPGAAPRALVEVLAALREPRKTTGGINLVVGLAPRVWEAVAPDELPPGAADFEPVVGPDGFTMPATQHDAWIWLAGSDADVVFDVARSAVGALAGLASLGHEVAGFTYLDSRDLTGFIDGTENPPLDVAAAAALVPEGMPGSGSSVAIVQRWLHDLDAFHALPVAEQEAAIGRTRADSIELDDDTKPADAHISRVVIEDEQGEELEILRRSIPVGGMRDHGLEFVAFSADQSVLVRMLHRMVGTDDGVRDHLTRFTTPLTGAFYVTPSVEALKAFAPDNED